MGNRQNQGVRRRQVFPRAQAEVVLVAGFARIGYRVVRENLDAEVTQLANDIDHLRVADVGAVFLEGEAEHVDAGALDVAAGVDHLLHRLARDVRPHAVVDAAAGKDHLGVIAGELGLVREVVGIDPYAMSSDETGSEGQEIPLGPSRVQDFGGVEAELVENDGKLVDEGDIEVPLRVFYHLGGFGHSNRRRAVNAYAHHRRVQVSKLFECFGIVPGHDLRDPGQAVLAVAGIDAFGGIPDVEILTPSHTGHLLEYRHANLFGRARVDGRLVNDGRARFEVLADRDAGRFERSEIGLPRGVDRGGNGHDDKFRVLELDRILGDTQEPRFLELRGGQLAGRVHAVLKVLDFLARQVVTDGWAVLSERYRERKPDIAQADYGDRSDLLAASGRDRRLECDIRFLKNFQHNNAG